ncbi:MAG: hypothetical protein AAFN10_28170, partial [Bacteroidota bacterium]
GTDETQRSGIPFTRKFCPNPPLLSRLMDPDIDKRKADHIEVINAFKQHYSKFEFSMQQNLSICFENYLGRQAVKSREQEDFKYHFDYYFWAAKEGLSLIHGSFPVGRYTAIVTAGINAGELEKTRTFMDGFTELLPLRFRADVHRLCEGMCLFSEKKYAELLKGFLRGGFPIPVYEVNGRLLHLQARYEIGERADLEVPLKSLLAFTKRHASLNPGFRGHATLKIQLFLKLLMHFKREKLLKMQAEADKIKSYAFRNWILGNIKKRLAGEELLPS